jgi:hypothetical protein
MLASPPFILQVCETLDLSEVPDVLLWNWE